MRDKLLTTLGEGKVFFPVSKILKESNNKTEAYILFEATQREWITLPPKIIRAAINEGYDIRGFCSNGMKPNSYFQNFRIFKDDNGEVHWLVYRKEINGRQVTYRLVSEDNKDKCLSREELVNFINDGNVVLGTKKLGDKVLITSELITIVNDGSICKNNYGVKRMPSIEEIYAKMGKEKYTIIK